MLRYCPALVVLAFFQFPLAAQPPSSSVPPTQVTELQKQLKQAQGDIKTLQSMIRDVADTVSKMAHESAEFDPTSPNSFISVDSTIGPLLLVFDKAEPYLNGYRVYLKIGNPHFARITSYDLTATWSSRYVFNHGRESYLDWFRKRKTKTVQSSVALASGQWTPLNLILPATTAKEFEFLELSLKVHSVELTSGPQPTDQ